MRNCIAHHEGKIKEAEQHKVKDIPGLTIYGDTIQFDKSTFIKHFLEQVEGFFNELFRQIEDYYNNGFPLNYLTI